ncbi:hypothetical protein A6770_33780 [Nostoc minutum NIES-26]|uniref:TIR domain-containing protein n=1 Tax=Nostoc minutum NIES-26 TaxID=1844469 RepID=A0A367Q0B1_9NOSO|nr:toll/interleukin-1 receptor domain-containing protein [Dendronalium sp. ChiSLP03b]MDZ8209317.1 toll/interleukin-1 receptor domain-containing protein [Dendronalium sp. ChiSLP03b]RCJ17598.1 hypothetical protein A6770_33780 [Nostoc minutum NIES-26]
MEQFEFNVFLCHNSKDKPAVIEVAEQLKQCEIKPWLDIWESPPGRYWQASLEFFTRSFLLIFFDLSSSYCTNLDELTLF